MSLMCLMYLLLEHIINSSWECFKVIVPNSTMQKLHPLTINLSSSECVRQQMRTLLLLLQRRTHRTVCAHVILCSLLIPGWQESRRLVRAGRTQADGCGAAGSPAANRRIMILAWKRSVWLTPSLCLTTTSLIRPCSWAGLLCWRRL